MLALSSTRQKANTSATPKQRGMFIRSSAGAEPCVLSARRGKIMSNVWTPLS